MCAYSPAYNASQPSKWASGTDSIPKTTSCNDLFKVTWLQLFSLSEGSLCAGTQHHLYTPTEVVGQLDIHSPEWLKPASLCLSLLNFLKDCGAGP